MISLAFTQWPCLHRAAAFYNVRMNLQQVHLRVNDAGTGQPTPCRIRFTDPQGRYYAPLGRLTSFATSRGVDVGGNLRLPVATAEGVTPQEYAYIEGGCEIGLPPGPLRVQVYKGPEYLPVDQTVQLQAGKLALRLTLQRFSDLRQAGWHPGDGRAHYLSPHAAALEGAGEDLAIVHVLARPAAVYDDGEGWQPEPRTEVAYPQLLAFSGQELALSRYGCDVAVNTHNSHPYLGSLGLLHSHRVVYPLAFGGPPFGEPFENWTLADWCDQCHRKHGLVVWTETHLPPGERRYREALANLILGKVDAVEVSQFGFNDAEHPWEFNWYDLLNCGMRVPLLGASAKDSNYLPLGSVRTWARVDGPMAHKGWIEAVRSGRTVASNGPLLTFTVDGNDPGATVRRAAGEPFAVAATAVGHTPFDTLEIVANGKVVAATTPTTDGPLTRARIEQEIALPEGGWVAARCWGKAWVAGYALGQRVYAHASPVYCRVDGQKPPVDKAAARFLAERLGETIGWVDTQGRYETDSQRVRLRKVFEEAQAVLQKRAE